MKMKLRSLLPLLTFATKLAASTAFSLSVTPSLRLPPSAATRVHTNAIASTSQHHVVLSMTSAPEAGADKKIEGRKKRVIVGYKAITASFIAVAAASFAKAGITFPIARVLAAFVAMPAGVSYIMISAAENDRLGSDTYKRLNLALWLNGIGGLAAIALGGNSMLALPFVLSVINSTKGYAYGALGWDKKSSETTLLRDLTQMIGGMVRGFFSVPKNGKAFIYLVATALVSSLKLLKLFEIVQFVRANALATGLAPLLARFNRLTFFSLVLYTLKDAADRDRLGGTTFIQLNYLSALSMGVNYAFYSGGAPEIAGALSAAFAAFFAFTGVSSYMKNQYA